MQTLYATCGLAFSGKTTLAKRLAEILSISRVSLDDINSERGLHGGEGMTDAQWEETSEIAARELRQILAANQSVVLDDTLSHRFLRDRYRDVATKGNADFVLLFVNTSLEEIGKRMQKNCVQRLRHHVDPDVFAAHRDRFQRPTEDEQAIYLSSNIDIEHFLASVK